MKLLGLLAELRRRRVVRTAAAYVVAAWLVIEVVATIFPIVGLPDWVSRVVLALLAIGLPVTLAVSWSFDLTGSGLERTPPAEAEPAVAPAPRPRRVLTAALIVVAVLAGSGWFAASRFVTARAAELDSNLIAVAPFRVSGADAAVAYLREGLVDLIAVKLTGSRRAVDPGTTLSAWRGTAGDGSDPSMPAAKRLAGRLGARTVLVGSVVGTADALTLTASLYDVATGRELATGSAPGTADELPALVDRLVATVLSIEAGENDERLTSLTSTSLPAVRAYLDGNAHYRRGRYIEAVQSYARAIEIDSTFALAALAMYDPAGMEEFSVNWQTRARQLVQANVERLPPRERAYFEARFPRERAPNIATWLRNLEQLTKQFPDRWEAWYAYADALFHWGDLVTPRGNNDRARAGFERALALDSTHSVVIQHLISTASKAPDTALVFRYSDRYLQQHPSGAFSFDLRLRTAAWREDSATVQRFYAGVDTLGNEALGGIVTNHQLGPRPLIGLVFARRAGELLFRRAGSVSERSAAVWQRAGIELNGARPRAALALLDSLRRADRVWWPRERIYDAVFLDGDTVAATEAADVLERRLKSLPVDTFTERDAGDLCAVTLLRVTRGRTDGAAAAIERLRMPHPATATPAERPVCAAMLSALLSHVARAPDAETHLLSLDSLMRTGPYSTAATRDRANLVAARLFEERNNVNRAYDAASRRLIGNGGERHSRPFYELACRLGAAVGRFDEALWACPRYLILLEDAEPGFAPKAEAARKILERAAAREAR